MLYIYIYIYLYTCRCMERGGSGLPGRPGLAGHYAQSPY